MAISPDGTRAYVSNFSYTGSAVSVIDTATDTVIGGISVGAGANGLAVSPDGAHVYVCNLVDCTVSVIDTTTNTAIAAIPVGQWPIGAAVSPDGATVYVTNGMGDSVSVIDTTTNTAIAAIPVGHYPYGVAFSPDGTHVYVANTNSGSVSVISVAAAPIDNWHPPGLIGQLLGALDRDGGGWLVIGNHFIPIPPRSPFVSVIARAAVPYLGRSIESPELGKQVRNLL